MAGNITNYLERKLLEHGLGSASYTLPTTYVGLYTADPGETGDQTNEVTGGSYARQTYGPTWNSNHVENAAIVRFNSMPAATVTHVAIFDASTVGNMLWYGPLASSVTVPSGFPLEFAAGSLQASLD